MADETDPQEPAPLELDVLPTGAGRLHEHRGGEADACPTRFLSRGQGPGRCTVQVGPRILAGVTTIAHWDDLERERAEAGRRVSRSPGQ